MGASLKKAFVALVTLSDSRASTWLGKVPLAANALTCCSGAVSQSATSFASSTFSPWDGTVRNEPPQLPPPPGKTLAMSQPLTPSALPSTTPSIHPGHAMVAKPSFWKDAVQSSPHCGSLVDRPLSMLPVTSAQTALSSSFSTSTVLSSVSKGFATWLSMACASPPEESYHAVSGTLLMNSSPRAK